MAEEKQKLHVIGLGGSLALRSTSLAALKIALEGAAEAGAETTLLDLRKLNLPMFQPDNTNAPEEVRRVIDLMYQADGLVWSSPMYNGTISGAFKNALDWLHLLGDREPPFLTDKIVGLISTAGGVQGLQVVNTMEFVVRALRGWAVPLVMPVAQSWKAFDNEGHARDSRLSDQLRALGHEVVRASCQFALEPPSRKDVRAAESAIQPLSVSEAKASG